MTTNIIVSGAKGRMGQMVLQACVQAIADKTPLNVIGAVDVLGSTGIGGSVGIPGLDLDLADSLDAVLQRGAVIIDFTVPDATMNTLAKAQSAGVGMVIGTTGFSEFQKDGIRAASKHIPIMMSPNMSIGVNVMFKVAETVARIMGSAYDVEIVEAHHNQKKDSPSGTALGFAEAVARGHAVNLKDKAIYGREGMPGARPKGEIGIHAVRGGDIVGDHSVLFAGPGERLELKHVAHSRQTFAQGAVRAALFLKDKPNGLFSMFDVLGL